MPFSRRRGFGIYYETHGGGPGLPLVLVMGMGGTCRGWTVLQTPELSRERTNVIFDNRGAGRSEDPGEPFTTRDMAEDTLALLDDLGIAEAHVLGGFLGGLVAQELAIAHPERVRSLVLVGSYARLDAKRRMLLEVWRGLAACGVPRELRVKLRLVWTLHDATLEMRDLIDAMIRFYMQDDAPLEDKAFVRQADACLAHDSLERLDRIRCPALVVGGEQDLLTPPHLQRELARGIRRARLVLLPGAGHLVAAEAAPLFNQIVANFLREQDRAPSG